jgi:hypothetical protein
LISLLASIYQVWMSRVQKKGARRNAKSKIKNPPLCVGSKRAMGPMRTRGWAYHKVPRAPRELCETGLCGSERCKNGLWRLYI